MIKGYFFSVLFLLTISCTTKNSTSNGEELATSTEDTATTLRVSYSEEDIAEMAAEAESYKKYKYQPQNDEDEHSPRSTDKTDTTQMNKAEKLMWLHDKTVQLEGEERATFEKLFLREFPNSFKEYQKLYGFDMDTGAAPLYNNMNHVMLFASLEKVEKEDYYNKYLNISVNGVWGADNIQDFGVYTYMINDPETMIDVMDNRSDEEIISIIRFVFDGPHPDKYQEKFDSLISVIKPYSERIAVLTTKSYQQLLSKHDGHGH